MYLKTISLIYLLSKTVSILGQEHLLNWEFLFFAFSELETGSLQFFIVLLITCKIIWNENICIRNCCAKGFIMLTIPLVYKWTQELIDCVWYYQLKGRFYIDRNGSNTVMNFCWETTTWLFWVFTKLKLNKYHWKFAVKFQNLKWYLALKFQAFGIVVWHIY